MKIYCRCRVSISKWTCPSFKLKVKKQKLWQDFLQKSLFFKVFLGSLGESCFFGVTKSICFALQCLFLTKSLTMSDTCVSVDCNARWDKKTSQGLTTSFQTLQRVEIKWIWAVRHDNWVLSASNKLCCNHFTEDCFTTKPTERSFS